MLKQYRPWNTQIYIKKTLINSKNQMISIDEFRKKLADNEQEYILEKVLLASGAKHVSDDDIEYIRENIASKFRISVNDLEICITGSAKLGFSLVEKRVNGIFLQRYRLFSPVSDIDVAVVSKSLYEIIWIDLSKRAHRVTALPWNSKRLGDYMVYGWLRPDHFPIDVRIQSCDDWWDLFRKLSSNPRYQRRKVRGGLFYSKEQLSLYMNRSLNDCKIAEELLG